MLEPGLIKKIISLMIYGMKSLQTHISIYSVNIRTSYCLKWVHMITIWTSGQRITDLVTNIEVLFSYPPSLLKMANSLGMSPLRSIIKLFSLKT